MIDNKVEEIRKHVESILELLEIEKTNSTENTALRVAKMYCNEVFKHRNNIGISELDSQMKLFSLETPYTTPICVGNIDFSSMCEHHLLPFFGTCKVTYVPKDKVIGLSKIPRVVKFFSKKPQLQERLTNEIGNYLYEVIDPSYLSVELTALHSCVMCRGAESNIETVTLYTRGI